jgi:hypothetical protein
MSNLLEEVEFKYSGSQARVLLQSSWAIFSPRSRRGFCTTTYVDLNLMVTLAWRVRTEELGRRELTGTMYANKIAASFRLSNS